jgi:hypothetical protein
MTPESEADLHHGGPRLHLRTLARGFEANGSSGFWGNLETEKLEEVGHLDVGYPKEEGLGDGKY